MTAGLIGPNALLQLGPVLVAEGGTALRDEIFALGGAGMPPAEGMMPEAPAARVHQALRARLPHEAPRLARAAGEGVGRYILAHRIPRAAQVVLKALPPPLAARMLSRAIARHAWTFAGSGVFSAAGPWTFEIGDNPIVRGEVSDVPLCHWHAAVFETLYRALVARDVLCRETACCAQGAPACRFEIARGGQG
ncbi:bacteriochlorophyll 4-vinyl reductase [Histidinibacterium lentulum]|uniref:bacteriochlorophyll 4-vinyl reductase n=1 Tax=Histidinibacterium lentulum TaxID=2480588 RepID=UPI001FE427DA|nr:bacteriochlorophyll 4-vinyl reductase [Histidinibacterium lentulum]